SDSKEQQLLSEVWFAGVHSDIGGGYSHTWGCKYYWKNGVEHYDGLETIPLNWMIANFKEEHLFPDISPFPECQDGELHDEYFHTDLFRIIDNPLSRKPDPKDVIHESVLKRIQSQKLRVPHPQREPIGQYLPINLKYPVPCSYTIGRTNGVEPTLQPEMMRCMETPIRTSSN
ncbi:MAG: phospholipase effector Tle1 domain-containing protein, partial [Flavitalea sp.]